METQEIIKQLVTTNPVVLYMKGTPLFPQCGFSGAAVKMLADCEGPNLFTVDVLTDSEMRGGIKLYSNWPTIPQLYVKGKFIGGSDIMRDMFKQGELQELLKLAER